MPTLADLLRGNVGGLLSPAEEFSYQKWRDEKAPQAESPDYDLRGYYKGLLGGDPVAMGAMGNDGQPHFPDKWKRPSHPTFSRESMYYDPKTMPNTPAWQPAPMNQLPGMANNFLLKRPDGSIVSVDTPWSKYNFLTGTDR